MILYYFLFKWQVYFRKGKNVVNSEKNSENIRNRGIMVRRKRK